MKGSYPSYSMLDGNQGRYTNEGPREGSYPSYSMSGRNQGWNNDWEGRWKEREWYSRDANWGDSDRDRYVFLHDHQVPMDPSVNSESSRTKDMLSRILSKVEGSDVILQELKTDFSSLNQIVASHTMSIKHL